MKEKPFPSQSCLLTIRSRTSENEAACSKWFIGFSTVFLKRVWFFCRDSLGCFCSPPVCRSAATDMEHRHGVMQNLEHLLSSHYPSDFITGCCDIRLISVDAVTPGKEVICA